MEPTPVPIPVKTPELHALFLEQGRVETTATGCVLWTGAFYPQGGYGRFYVPELKRSFRAHRVIYAWTYGDTTAILDHTCHNPLACDLDANGWCEHRRCVNPVHLEATTRGENVRRGLPGSPLWHPLGNSLKLECVKGHAFTPENTYINPRGERQCRTCLRDSSNRYNAANRDKVNAKKREAREPVVYPEQPCQWCGMPFTPQKVTGRYCLRRDCINSRQRENRKRRMRGTDGAE